MINEQIRDKEVRVIGENGEMIGVMSSRDAMKLAREAELDLVKITVNTDMSLHVRRRKPRRNRR